MNGIWGIIKLSMVCGTFVTLAILVLLAIPQSQFRDVVAAIAKSVLQGIGAGVSEAKGAKEGKQQSGQ
ncbi:hypothetical protein Mal52_36860 [Symmachiella dynata]|uniref:Uncharacterized protein n=1 Tax=Symmachiella dynata TaxID=2527995 RepID=A0A517ZS26_9PLAN|nr:hypothetical protein [Symmachiella dynata]QDU45195.1 hypothetical protein Mal52_36860 [Symmachiella dynata]